MNSSTRFSFFIFNISIALQLDLTGFKSSFRIWRHWMTKEGGNFARDITNREGEANVWKELPKMLIGCSSHTLPAMLKLLDEAVFPPENVEWAESTKNKLQDELMVRFFIIPFQIFLGIAEDSHYFV